MIKEVSLSVQPDKISDHDYLKKKAAGKLHLNLNDITAVQVTKRSLDARGTPKYQLKLFVFVNEPLKELFEPIDFQNVENSKRAIIVGSGPAGLFAALKLIQLGIKPVIFERGKDVQSRRKDLRSIQQDGIVNPDSNYCFGEGGAGTYSDGKLYTRATKRGNVTGILNLLVQHGAQNEILIDSHPHIGSNILPKVVASIRETITNSGGEFHFNSKVTDFILSEKNIKGVIVNSKDDHLASAVILATGHSARDVYYLLRDKNIAMEAKDFAIGVRIEHPQQIINKIQYHSHENPNLPAAAYNLACQIEGRGVYSFCMCPGGIIIPASTDSDELVLNGMSVSRRDSPFANSGIVVTVEQNDFKQYKNFGIFAGLEYQKLFERNALKAGGGKQKAPAQRITDFAQKKVSTNLPKTSYIPGVTSFQLEEILPKKIVYPLRKSIRLFGDKMKGYFTEEAQILAAETRTSSPLRILRDKESFMHPEVSGLYPAGEGAGYAGGIISAAIDGERCAEACAKYLA